MSGNPDLFDRALLRKRRERAARTENPPDFLQRRAADDIADRLSLIRREFPRSLVLGSDGGLLAQNLARLDWIGEVVSADNSLTLLDREAELRVVCDEELLPFAAGSLDLVVSSLALHHVNDLPGTLAQVRRALKPDGLFMGALLGSDTLHELRAALTEAESELTGGAGPRVAPFADLRDLGALLGRAGLALPVADTDRIIVRYSSLLDLLHDLRCMGMTNVLNARSRRALTRETLALAEAIWRRDHADPHGRLRATFEIVTLTGWAPHASQQIPLTPGSAQTRLADALGVEERSAEERAPGSDRR